MRECCEMSDNRVKPLWGAKAIGTVAGTNVRKTFYLLENKILPGRKVGGVWQSTEGEIQDFLLGGASQREKA
jgi:hypothetical protein